MTKCDKMLKFAKTKETPETAAEAFRETIQAWYDSGGRRLTDIFTALLKDPGILSGADLHGLILRGVDFTGTDLTDTDLTGADLTGADLSEAILSNTILTGAKLIGANLHGLDLTGFDFFEADLTGTDLTDTILTDAKFVITTLTGTNFAGADLTEANFTGANLTRAILTNTILRRANLNGSNLTGLNLSGLDLTEVILTGAVITGTNFTWANLTKANLGGSKHSDAIFIRANLTEAILSRLDLSGLDFTEANLTRAIFTGANLTGSNLTRADLTDAIITRANLTGSNLTDVDLRGFNLSGLDLTEANLTRTILINSNLTGTIFTKTILFGANLTNADLTEANLTGANLTRAILTDAVLIEAILIRTNFTGVDFSGFDFSGLDFTEANLTRANLTDAILTRTNLRKSNLTDADLTRARFSGADLTRANLTGAIIADTIFIDPILVGVIGLDPAILKLIKNQASPEAIKAGMLLRTHTSGNAVQALPETVEGLLDALMNEKTGNAEKLAGQFAKQFAEQVRATEGAIIKAAMTEFIAAIRRSPTQRAASATIKAANKAVEDARKAAEASVDKLAALNTKINEAAASIKTQQNAVNGELAVFSLAATNLTAEGDSDSIDTSTDFGNELLSEITPKINTRLLILLQQNGVAESTAELTGFWYKKAEETLESVLAHKGAFEGKLTSESKSGGSYSLLAASDFADSLSRALSKSNDDLWEAIRQIDLANSFFKCDGLMELTSLRFTAEESNKAKQTALDASLTANARQLDYQAASSDLEGSNTDESGKKHTQEDHQAWLATLQRQVLEINNHITEFGSNDYKAKKLLVPQLLSQLEKKARDGTLTDPEQEILDLGKKRDTRQKLITVLLDLGAKVSEEKQAMSKAETEEPAEDAIDEQILAEQIENEVREASLEKQARPQLLEEARQLLEAVNLDLEAEYGAEDACGSEVPLDVPIPLSETLLNAVQELLPKFIAKLDGEEKTAWQQVLDELGDLHENLAAGSKNNELKYLYLMLSKLVTLGGSSELPDKPDKS